MRTIPAQDRGEPGTLSGRILICGTGFLVASGMWAILGFFRYAGGLHSAGYIDLLLTIANLAVGVLVFKRARGIWFVGLALCGIGLAAVLPNHYYFPLAVEGVLGLLFYLSRADFPDMAIGDSARSDHV
ncbi:MAG: hypothetical protein WBW04_20800 [Nitrolancea sp.]